LAASWHRLENFVNLDSLLLFFLSFAFASLFFELCSKNRTKSNYFSTKSKNKKKADRSFATSVDKLRLSNEVKEKEVEKQVYLINTTFSFLDNLPDLL
jgi:hypothetical protein